MKTGGLFTLGVNRGVREARKVNMIKYAPILEKISQKILIPGAKVKLATEKELEKRFGKKYFLFPPTVVRKMRKFLGSVVTINNIVGVITLDHMTEFNSFNAIWGIPKNYNINRSRFRIIEDGGKWVWGIWMLNFNNFDFNNIKVNSKENIFFHLQRFKKAKKQLERIRMKGGSYE